MAGSNQHHIPQFLQRGFSIPKTRRKCIWKFEKDQAPENCEIKRTGAVEHFYSEPSPDGSRTLDDDITDQETPLVRLFESVRAMPAGTAVDPVDAAKIIMHLVPRTAHVRTSLERGVRQLAGGLSELFTSKENLTALVGMDKTDPSPLFQKAFAEAIHEHAAGAEIIIPHAVLERMAFVIARENFQGSVDDIGGIFSRLFQDWIEGAEALARNSHNKALAALTKENVRQQFLETLEWLIEPAPAEGAILPDCVSFVTGPTGEGSPLMFAEPDDIVSVVMPLSSNGWLVGRQPSAGFQCPIDLNREAVRVSHDYYLAGPTDDRIVSLHDLIGEQATRLIDVAIDEAMQEHRPSPNKGDVAAIEPSAQPNDKEDEEPWVYQLSFLGCGDEITVGEYGKTIQYIVNAIGLDLPMRRLDGITFAYDYPAALRELDRGFPNAAAATTVDPEIGIGVAQTVNVQRDGQVKGRVMLCSTVLAALVADNPDEVAWALPILVGELAKVALIEYLERALPGIHFQAAGNSYEGFFYPHVNAALHSYLAAYLSASYGDGEAIATTRQGLLGDAITRGRAAILSARLAYRFHGDLEKFLRIAMPAIGLILMFAGDLLGHCAAMEREAVDHGSPLAQALDEAGLRQWIVRFGTDLAVLEKRLGKWEAFDEFLAFNIHVERLMWQFGMIPWNSPEGNRIEIPLGSDADALMATGSQNQLEEISDGERKG